MATSARTTEGVAVAVETAIDNLITEVTSYLAEGEGNHQRAREAVARRVGYRLKQAFGIDLHSLAGTGDNVSLTDAHVDGFGA